MLSDDFLILQLFRLDFTGIIHTLIRACCGCCLAINSSTRVSVPVFFLIDTIFGIIKAFVGYFRVSKKVSKIEKDEK